MHKYRLMQWIVAGMILGIITGWLCHHYFPDEEKLKIISGYFNIITDIFLRLIKVIIAPLVFSTIVASLMSMGRSYSIAGITIKAIIWFICAALISLTIGMLLTNVFHPGAGMNIAVNQAEHIDASLAGSSFDFKRFISHLFPRSIAEAMANNDILQILIFSLFFGSALGFINKDENSVIAKCIHELTKVMFRITDYVMLFSPLAVFAAMASAITTEGLGLLYDYGKLIGLFYIGLLLLWCCLFLAGYLFLGKKTFNLLKLIREPIALAFATASSESAYPKTMAALNKFGVPDKITSFVLPLGYSFNLDGSMLYQSFAILFIAQAYNIELSFTEQIIILLTLMVTSKGMAGVARASIVVVTATLPIFHLPEAGILLILGIDQFFDMGRTATNVVGNSISIAVISHLQQKKSRPDK